MITIVFYRERDGSTPFLKWFDRLPGRGKVQCRARLGLLAQQGHMLRRPAADFLRDGIYELRATAGRVQYRMLYFFHERKAVVISHGITKRESAVPPDEINQAIRRKQAFQADPKLHSTEEAL